jgi:hypothetical protein
LCHKQFEANLRNVKTLACSLAVFLVLTPFAPAQLVWDQTVREHKAGIEERSYQTTFSFTNKGSKPVAITKIMSSCGCTSAIQSKTGSYGPGESGNIMVHFDYGARVGNQIKDVTVYTDDPTTPAHKLQLRVDIPQLFSVYPMFVVWLSSEAMSPKPVYVKVTHSSPIKVVKAICDNTAFQADLRELKPGGEYLLLVTPPSTPTPARTKITLQTDFPATNPRIIELYAEIKSVSPIPHMSAPGQSAVPVPQPANMSRGLSASGGNGAAPASIPPPPATHAPSSPAPAQKP